VQCVNPPLRLIAHPCLRARQTPSTVPLAALACESNTLHLTNQAGKKITGTSRYAVNKNEYHILSI